MAVRDILLLGDERLYRVSEEVRRGEVDAIREVVQDLHDTMVAFQKRHGWGRAIAAPQIGVTKRVVCMNVDGPRSFLNPVLHDHSADKLTFWEDCMSFPELLVKLENPRSCRLTYRDLDWREHHVYLEGDMAELLQHEADHLDGILAVQRALDDRSIALRRARPAKDTRLTGIFRPLDP
jgi:peptide deformylase